MKRAFLTFAMAMMLTASLVACTSTPAGTNQGGSGNGTTAGSGAAGARARGGNTGDNTMGNHGRYYADDNGDVFGDNDGIGGKIGRAADDMMDGVGNAMRDMTGR